MMDRQEVVMVGGEGEENLKRTPAHSTETLLGPRHSVALVVEGAAITWQLVAAFFV